MASVAMARRGRSRKPGRRQPNGRLRREMASGLSGVEMRRIQIMRVDGAERDMRLSTPLGVVRARLLITEAEYQAGLEFDRRWVLAERPRSPQSCIATADRIPGAGSEGPSARAERDYREAREVLIEAGLRVYRQVVNIALYKHWPQFLDTERRRTPAAWRADQRDVDELRAGLDRLMRKFGLRYRDDAASDVVDSVASFLLRRASRSERGL